MYYSLPPSPEVTAALQQSAAKLERLAASVSGVICQILWSPDGSIAIPFISANCWQIFAVSAEAIQQDAQVLIHLVHPDDQLTFQQSLAVSGATLQLWQWQGRMITPHQTLKWIRATAQPELQPNGEVGWDGWLLDITERQQAEIALQASEKRLAGILDIADDAIISVNAAQEIQLFNQGAEKTFGYAAAEVLGQPISLLLPRRFAAEHPSHIQEFAKCPHLARKMGDRRQVLGLRKDGSEFAAEASISKLSLESGYIFTVILRDITERQRAEVALRQSEAKYRQLAEELAQTLKQLQHTQTQLIQTEKMSSLGQLVAGVAHEINNPVNFIYGNVTHANEYLQDLLQILALYQKAYPHPGPEITAAVEEVDLEFLVEDLQKLLASMRLGADRIRQIVLSLRSFSRLDEAEMKPVDIHEGIESTLLILQNRFKAKPEYPNIEVVKQYGTLPEVECYAGQLNQVFMNILSNAIDALNSKFQHLPPTESHQHPTITIHTEYQAPERILIRIADNGSGMSSEVQQHLFEPFFTTKPVGQGTGLGMSISYQIISEKHRGTLQCCSTLGEGSEFMITIPRHQSQ